MTLWNKPKRWKQSIKDFSNYLQHHLESLISHTGQFVRRNRAASIIVGLVVVGVLGATVATSWRAHLAKIAKARAEQLANEARQLAQLRAINYKDTLDDLIGVTRKREGQDAFVSEIRHDLTDPNSLGLSIGSYNETPLDDDDILPATYEVVADNPNDRTYQRTFPMTYPHPGGVSYVSSADSAAGMTL